MTHTRRVLSHRPPLAVRGLASVLVVALVALFPTTAQAGPEKRKSEVRTAVAVLAEVMHHEGGYPKKLTRKKLTKKYHYTLAKKFRIAKYKRLKGGDHFRVCLRHKKGGWATWHSAKGKIRASGKGRACRF